MQMYIGKITVSSSVLAMLASAAAHNNTDGGQNALEEQLGSLALGSMVCTCII